MIAARRVAVGIWLIGLGVAGLVLFTSTTVKTEMSLLLPDAITPAQGWFLTQIRHGPASRLLLIGVEGKDPDALAAGSQQLAQWMRTSGDFSYVSNGGDDQWLDEIDRIFRYRYLMSPSVTKEQFQPEGLRGAFKERLRDLASPVSLLVRTRIPEDPTGEFAMLLQTVMPGQAPARYQGVWVNPARTRAILMAETKVSGFDLDAQERVQLKLLHAFEDIRSEMGTAESLRLLVSGPAVFAVEARRTIKEESWRLSAMALALVVVFLGVAYRSVVLAGLTVIPLVSAAIVSAAIVGVVFGFIHGITLAFGVVLIGVAVDYPLHLFSHVHSGETPEDGCRRIWPTMRLGVVTTVMGFSVMVLTGFPGLSQLGCFAMVGLVVAGLVTRWVLPLLVPVGFSTSVPKWTSTHSFECGSRGFVVFGGVLLAAIGSLMVSSTPLWENDLANLSPVSEEKKTIHRELRTQLSAPDVRDLLVITGPTEQAVLERSEDVQPRLDQLISDRAMEGYDMAARLMPSRKTQLRRQALLPGREQLQRNVAQASAGLPFQPTTFAPFVQAVEDSRNLAPLSPKDLEGRGLGVRIASMVFPQDGQWVALVLLRGVFQRDAVAAMVTQRHDPTILYIDMKGESNRMVLAYRDRGLALAGWGGVAISLVLLLGLRSMQAVARVLLPVGGGVVVVVAVLHGMGERLSLFHLASLLLVVGIALDYALFFNRRFQTVMERRQTVFAIGVCSVTTILVFGILAWSDLPVLRAIGLTAASGSLVCVLFSTLLNRKPVFEIVEPA